MMVRQASRRGVAVGRANLAGGMATPSLPTCPFARRGLDDAAMGTCPGYVAATVSFHGIGAGESIGRRESCAHLDVQHGPRGYVSACQHPGGLPAGAAELARSHQRAKAG